MSLFHFLSSSGLRPHWNLLVSSNTPRFFLVGPFRFSPPFAQNSLLQSTTCGLLLIIHVSFETSQQREVPSAPKLWKALHQSTLHQLTLVNLSSHLLASEIILGIICLPLYGLSPQQKIHFCKSNPQWGTITRQSGWLLSKSLQAINAGVGVEKREPSYTIVGNAN